MKCSKQGRCALRDRRCLCMTPHCDPGAPVALVPGGLSMICGAWGLLYWPQINEGRGGSVRCHQFLHFKQTSGHRLHLQSLISTSDQTGAERPLQMSPKSPSWTPVNSVKRIISCYKSYDRRNFSLKGNMHSWYPSAENGAKGQSETEAVISQQRGHYSSRSNAVTAAAGTRVVQAWGRKHCNTLVENLWWKENMTENKSMP